MQDTDELTTEAIRERMDAHIAAASESAEIDPANIGLIDLESLMWGKTSWRPDLLAQWAPSGSNGENGGDKLVHGSGGISQPRAE